MQANDFLESLHTISGLIYTTHFDISNALSQQFGIQKKDLFLQLLRKNNITQVAQLEDFFKRVQESVTNLPVVTLTVAFNPTDQTLKKISEWFLFTLKKHVLFDIAIDTKLIAGGIIGCNGKSKDYSIKQLFDTILEREITQQASQQKTLPALHQSVESIMIGR